jgi:hypothetical protein
MHFLQEQASEVIPHVVAAITDGNALYNLETNFTENTVWNSSNVVESLLYVEMSTGQWLVHSPPA